MSSKTLPETLAGRTENDVAWLCRRVWSRLNENNEHFVTAIVGPEGSGKSYSAIKLAETIDPEFTADNIIFRLERLFEMLRDGEYSAGDMYVFDEAGVELGNRTWQDRAQILANQGLQLIRSHNIGLIFTLPALGALDSQAEGRLQMYFEVVKKVDTQQEQFVRLQLKNLQKDRSNTTNKVYQKYPRRIDSTGLLSIPRRVEKIELTPPSDSIINDYEPEKNKFQDKQYDTILAELQPEQDEESQSPKDIATDLVEDGYEDYVSEHGSHGKPYVDKDLLRADYGLSHTEAKETKKLIEREVEL